MSDECKEVKMIILHKKGDTMDIKITDLAVYFPTRTNCLHAYYKKTKQKTKQNKTKKTIGKGSC